MSNPSEDINVEITAAAAVPTVVNDKKRKLDEMTPSTETDAQASTYATTSERSVSHKSKKPKLDDRPTITLIVEREESLGDSDLSFVVKHEHVEDARKFAKWCNELGGLERPHVVNTLLGLHRTQDIETITAAKLNEWFANKYGGGDPYGDGLKITDEEAADSEGRREQLAVCRAFEEFLGLDQGYWSQSNYDATIPIDANSYVRVVSLREDDEDDWPAYY